MSRPAGTHASTCTATSSSRSIEEAYRITSETEGLRGERPDRIKRGGAQVTIPLNHKAANALRKWLEIREPV